MIYIPIVVIRFFCRRIKYKWVIGREFKKEEEFKVLYDAAFNAFKDLVRTDDVAVYTEKEAIAKAAAEKYTKQLYHVGDLIDEYCKEYNIDKDAL